ncbi:MAG: hypothetical protein A2014_12275 [Spirochaetes bacterium GWF1_49_6]|nr:MAG: hypothetical protein A2014_12275 [Spirochaetes bacterium GWF1_49_6]
MYLKDMLDNSFSDDAEFDDLDDFDYIQQFIPENDDYDSGTDFDNDMDDLDDLFLDDEEEFLDDDEEDDGANDDLDEKIFVDEDVQSDIPVILECDECGQDWQDTITEDEYQNDFDRVCPRCGSTNFNWKK